MTINDVARAAGVSRQTVSNAVNAPHKVAPATLRDVQEHINRLGYRANRAARQLRREHAGAWGFELDSRGEGRIGNVLDTFLVALTSEATTAGTHVMPFVADPLDPIPAYRDLTVGRHVDGFVLSNTRHQDPRPAWLIDQGIPFASFGRIWDDPTIADYADVDGAAGERAAVDYLRTAGYETIAFLGWPSGSPVGDDRRSGWVAAGGDGPSIEAESIVDPVQAWALIEEVGAGGAIVCASDQLAVGVWRALTKHGLTPGADVGIVGFDDSDLAAMLGLTSLAQPLVQIADHLLALLHGRATGSLLLEPELVIRDSTNRGFEPPARRRGNQHYVDPRGSLTTYGGTS